MYFNSFRRLWGTCGRQLSRKTVAKSLAACDSKCLHEENHLRFSNSKHFRFIEQRNISFRNDISLKTMRLGVLSWEKLKHPETHGRIVSLYHLRLGVEEQLLILSASCLSPGRVKKFQKFINVCLKVGHSSDLKHSKSTWRQSSCDSCEMCKNQHTAEREWSTTVVVLISGAFVWSRLIYERCLHLSDKFAYRFVHNNFSLRYA